MTEEASQSLVEGSINLNFRKTKQPVSRLCSETTQLDHKMATQLCK